MLLLTLLLAMTARAETLSHDKNAEVQLYRADLALSCLARDDGGALITLRPELLARSPLILAGHALSLDVRTNGAERCRTVHEMIAAGAVHGKGTSLLDKENGKLIEYAVISLEHHGRKAFEFRSVVSKPLKL